MLVKEWNKLPEFMQVEEVRPYYETLRKKKGQLILKRIFDIQDKDCEEHIYMFLIYLRVYDFESKKILTELLSVLGNPIDISDFANFMNEEFLNKLKLEEN